MKNILTKLLSTSIAMTLVIASASVVTTSTVKKEKAPDKTPAVIQTQRDTSGVGLLEAVEKKAAEKTVVEYKTVEKAKSPAIKVAAEAAEEVAVPAPVAEKVAEEVAAPARVAEKAAEEVAAPAPIAEEAAEEVAVPARVAEKATEEVAAPVPVVEKAAEEVAVPAPANEEGTGVKESGPVKVWDVSATENDRVKMAFYAESESDGVEKGTAVISGEGEMEDAVYTRFMSIESYLAAAKTVFEDYYQVEVELEYDETIDKLIDLDATLMIKNKETGEYLFSTPEMMAKIDLADFLYFSPTKIVIDEGITSVSEYAFLACADVKEVVIPSTVKTIAPSAFQYCTGLKSVVIPETITIENSAFYHCDSLETVTLADEAYYANFYAGLSAASVDNVLSLDEINALIDGGQLKVAPTVENVWVPDPRDHAGGAE